MMERAADVTRAAQMAYRVLADQQVRTLPVDPLCLLRRCRNTRVVTYAEAAELMGMSDADFERAYGLVDAFTLAQQDSFIICYRTGGNPARMRFTLAHELGHRVLRHAGTCRADETEADVFASHLLCPRPALAQMMGERPDEADVARMFYVTRQCARMVICQMSDNDEKYLSESSDDCEHLERGVVGEFAPTKREGKKRKKFKKGVDN